CQPERNTLKMRLIRKAYVVRESWSIVTLSVALWAATSFGSPTVLSESEVAREFDQRTWTHEHGLPDDRVKAILQTRDGYLWIGTPRGLARFDGLKFTVFDHFNTPELVNDDCWGLTDDGEGNLWVGTSDGVVRLRGNRFRRFTSQDGVQVASPLCRSLSG